MWVGKKFIPPTLANLAYSPRKFAKKRVIIQNVERDRFVAEEVKYFAENFGGYRQICST